MLKTFAAEIARIVDMNPAVSHSVHLFISLTSLPKTSCLDSQVVKYCGSLQVTLSVWYVARVLNHGGLYEGSEEYSITICGVEG